MHEKHCLDITKSKFSKLRVLFLSLCAQEGQYFGAKSGFRQVFVGSLKSSECNGFLCNTAFAHQESQDGFIGVHVDGIAQIDSNSFHQRKCFFDECGSDTLDLNLDAQFSILDKKLQKSGQMDIILTVL